MSFTSELTVTRGMSSSRSKGRGSCQEADINSTQ